ncbi:MAG: IS5 family transposase [Alphaproteobacteria bacterium]|nr:IS5 family transposase [Alphaproteobacteria bacterium]NKB55408.1 IS5 family transposase [Alphaproteobacteria bacterium]NKB55511.1 IS5 family transposase [Alphaproteobacteria bacterium]NKB55962.1 IS5 family transposase [Alphaproteobacteria bacterium]NKB56221.1 IS5 family transposase [Alphaproteobacteria bacterium]
MGEKRVGEGGFADAFVAPGAGSNKRLERIEGLFDWSRFEKLLKSVRSKKGRRGYPALSMYKAVLLQQWYGLSDPDLEEALGDRLSFRRFCGFSLSDETPDETTFVRFRAALAERKLTAKLLAETNRQLERHGLMLKTGTLIDATLIEASVSRPSGVSGERSALDPDADWTRRGRTAYFGYKAHIAVDQGSELIRDAMMTSAKTYESEVADALIQGDERAVYADKAYEHKERRRRLKARGIKDRIMHRSHKNQPALPHWQQVRNRLISPIRANVERLFGTLKRSYRYRRARYRGMQKNQSHLHLLCIAMNLRRAETLMP